MAILIIYFFREENISFPEDNIQTPIQFLPDATKPREVKKSQTIVTQEDLDPTYLRARMMAL